MPKPPLAPVRFSRREGGSGPEIEKVPCHMLWEYRIISGSMIDLGVLFWSHGCMDPILRAAWQDNLNQGGGIPQHQFGHLTDCI